jgi:hypothetical protein
MVVYPLKHGTAVPSSKIDLALMRYNQCHVSLAFGDDLSHFWDGPVFGLPQYQFLGVTCTFVIFTTCRHRI